MLAYWALFSFFAVGTAIESGRRPDFALRRPIWILGGVIIALMIGFRYEVGADWENYEQMFVRAGYGDLSRAVSRGDVGYQALNWLVNSMGGEIVWVNAVCALLFTWGLFRLARIQPDPWLAVLVAIPYMVVVASGYTRQGAALGVIMAGLASLGRGGTLLRFAAYVVVAATFHRTAVAVLPLVIFSRPRNRFMNVVGGAALLYVLYSAFLVDSVDTFVEGYIKTKYNSQGATIRVVMSVLTATLFFLRRRSFGFTPSDDRLWLYFSLAAYASLVALAISPSSTAVDRLSIYLMPLQLVVLCRVPFIYSSRQFGVAMVAAYCFAIQFVWLNYAVHAKYWIPYKVYPLFS